MSGFVRSGFARRRSYSARRNRRRGEGTPKFFVARTTTIRLRRFSRLLPSPSLSLSSFLERSLSHPLLPRASPRLTGEKLLRGASLFWLPYFTDFKPSALPLFRYPPFYPFSPLSPHPVPSAIPCLYSRYTSPPSCSPQRVTLSLIQRAVPASQRNVVPPSINPSPSTNTFHVRLCEFALISTCALHVCVAYFHRLTDFSGMSKVCLRATYSPGNFEISTHFVLIIRGWS